MTDALIGLGSSLGDRFGAIRSAVQALDTVDGTVVVSAGRLYRSPPVGPARGWFLNGAVRVRTRLGPLALLARCRAIERRLGRRPAGRWADRALDLDLLLYGDLVRSGCALVLPHPRMLERPFALLPAREAAPDFVHPTTGCVLSRIPIPAGCAPNPCGTLDAPVPNRYQHSHVTGSGSPP